MALAARATMRAKSGDIDGFIADIAIVRRLAREVGSGATLLERLVGVAVDDSIANQTVGLTAANGLLMESQCRAILGSLNGLAALPSLADGIDVGEHGQDWILSRA